MATGSSGQGAPQRPVFSPDGFWWWDGAQWRPAISPDGLWRWNGLAWEPNRPAGAPAAKGGSTVAIVAVLAFVGVIVLVSIFVIVVLLTMGNQIGNVLSNVAAALGSPSP